MSLASLLPNPLQDAALRKKVDERRQDAELRREFAAVAARQERERQWRVAKGQATAADLAGPVAPQPVGVVRDTWMTELPPERRQPTAAAMPTVGADKGDVVQTSQYYHLLSMLIAGAQHLLAGLQGRKLAQFCGLPTRCPPPALPRRPHSKASAPRGSRAGETPVAGQ